MTRMLILATFSLAATTLPLLAQTPNGPVQGAVQGTVKGTATVGQGVVQGAGQAGQYPQSYQEDGGQKAEAESPSNLDCTPHRN